MNENGHSWTVTDYEEVDGKMYEVTLLFVIDGDRLLEKELKREELT